jgi:hypothetical protein
LALKPKSRRESTNTVVLVEEKKTPHKQRIREIIKKPKEKFLTRNQEIYWDILGDNQITLCFGPAGVGKSYIAMKRAVDLLYDDPHDLHPAFAGKRISKEYYDNFMNFLNSTDAIQIKIIRATLSMQKLLLMLPHV